jgi:hypothetical protein
MWVLMPTTKRHYVRGHSITVEWSPIIYNIFYTEKCLLIGSCCGYKIKIISKKEAKELKPEIRPFSHKNKSLSSHRRI